MKDPGQTVRELYDTFSAGNPEGVLNLVSEEVEWNYPGRTPFSGQRRGRAGVREFIERLGQLIRIDRLDVQEVIEQGERVVVLGAERFTVRETGRRVEQQFAHVFTVRDGKVVRADLHDDTWAVGSGFGETAAERRAQLGPMGVTEPPFSGGGAGI